MTTLSCSEGAATPGKILLALLISLIVALFAAMIHEEKRARLGHERTTATQLRAGLGWWAFVGCLWWFAFSFGFDLACQ